MKEADNIPKLDNKTKVEIIKEELCRDELNRWQADELLEHLENTYGKLLVSRALLELGVKY